MDDKIYDCIIIGGGQSGLSCAYYLRRTGVSFVILDAQAKPGGAWQNCWDSLTLFSPAEFNSLPGTKMPTSEFRFPTKNEVVDYLNFYEEKYMFTIHRKTKVFTTHDEGSHYRLETTKGTYLCSAVISASGTFTKPYLPSYPGIDLFSGTQFHSSLYRNPRNLHGKKTLIVGSGNSAAQILAEVSEVTTTYWATDNIPSFLPNNIDGHDLFQQATKLYYAQKSGQRLDKVNLNLGDIVMVPSVEKGYTKGVFNTYKQIQSISKEYVQWTDGTEHQIDAIIWCTGFGFATDHLAPALEGNKKGRMETQGTRAVDQRGIWLVGYGNWTGFASSTLIGVGRTAKITAEEVERYVEG